MKTKYLLSVLTALTLNGTTALGQTVQYAFTNFAGMPGGPGNVDGAGSVARFWNTSGVAVNRAGNVYVADASNYTIRKITPTGAVTTLAGSAGQYGSVDGVGNAGRFGRIFCMDFCFDVFGPPSVAVDSTGNVYVADTGNHTIRKITPDGVVTTLAGRWQGSTDGIGSTARFDNPLGVAADGASNVYVADTESCTIRKVTPSGVVTTLAGSAYQTGSADGTLNRARFNLPSGVAVDSAGNVYVADTGNSTIRRVTPAGVVTTLAGSPGQYGSMDSTGYAARFNHPWGVAVDSAGNLYVADTYNHTIRKVTAEGVVTTLAGTAGQGGSADGAGSRAMFSNPRGVAVDSAGSVYVADKNNSTIRKVTPDGVVRTLAGTAPQYGNADGTGSVARFNSPEAMAVDSAGNVYVADTKNDMIRKITPAGVVTTLAVIAGRSSYPVDVAVDSMGNVYVADSGNHTIRKVTPTGVVMTLAGGQAGSLDGVGTAARFGGSDFAADGPMGVAVDRTGNVYVADTYNHTIRKISPQGVVTTLAGSAGQSGTEDGTGSAARFFSPHGVAVDSAGNVYVADASIRKVTPDGVVTTLAGISSGPGVAVDGAGNLYVAYGATIRKRTPDGVVTTVAGTAGVVGSADGVGPAAQFSSSGGVAVDSAGNLYVADSGNNRITKGTPVIVPPRFDGFSINGGAMTMTLSGLSAGATVILESSSNLRDWSPFQTNIVTSASLSVSRSINPVAGAEFLRAQVK